MYLPPYCWRQRRGAARRADQQRVSEEGWVAADALGKGAEKNGPQFLAQGARLDFLDYADDCVSHAAAGDTPADGVLVLEQALDEGLVDHSYLRPGGCFVGEIASGDARDTHRFEVAGAGHIELHVRAGTAGVRPAFNVKPVAPVSARERYRVGARGGSDARKGGHTLAQFAEELRGARRGVPVYTRIDGHGQDAARAEADVHSGGALQAAQKQPRGAEQHERHREPRDDQHVA